MIKWQEAAMIWLMVLKAWEKAGKKIKAENEKVEPIGSGWVAMKPYVVLYKPIEKTVQTELMSFG